MKHPAYLFLQMPQETLINSSGQAGFAVLDAVQGANRRRSGATAWIYNAAMHQNPHMAAARGMDQRFPQRQRGSTLVVALVMLVLLLMLAVTGMRAITVETRIAAHMLEARQLFEVADGALRDGERSVIGGAWQGVKLEQCAANAPPLDANGAPCWVSDAKSLFNTSWNQVAEVNGFANPYGYWYPRYIGADCRGVGANDALMEPTTGCTEYYEINAQGTYQDEAQDCGPDALCLRSSINQFIK